ncbi:unnamed protein product [Knipowitschia caucasica]
METEILKLILKSHGSMNTDELLYNLCEPSFLAELVNQKETFASCVFNGQPKVVVRSRLKLCGTVDCPGCGRLHLCLRFLLCGRCPFTQRGGCHFSHDLQSEYNMKLLSESGLQTLSRSELSLLLLQSHNMLLPQMCHQYNNSGSCQDDCKSLHMCKQYLHQDCSCPKNHDFCAPQPLKLLQEKHIPEHLFHRLKSVYANKEALRLADKANRSRDNNADGDRSADSSSIGAKQSRSRGSRGRGRGRGSKGQRGRQTASGSDGVTSKSEESGRGKIGSNPGNRGGRPGRSDLTGEDDMEEPSVGEALVCGVETESTGDNAQDETVASGAKSSSTADPSDHPSVKNVEAKSSGPPTRQRDKTEICMFFIKGHCIHEDRCFKSHDKMPYRWEIKQDGQWTHMAENESIERDYCVPDNTYSSTSPPVHFDTMRCNSNEVRRLSTVNSVLQPDFIHTTDWLWYWEDEYGKWYQYAALTSEHRMASISSTQLEQIYVQKDQEAVEFTAGSHTYSISFQDMIQTNLKFKTKRLVRRRPRFVSAVEVQTTRKRPTSIPDYWDKTQLPQTGFKRVSLQPSTEEYKEIQELFSQTMTSCDILHLERIQNKALWEAYQLKKIHMKNNSRKPVLEKKLFHGTDPKYVDTICATNFDWRVCGVNGTAYGQGSYFARDASYSHRYTGTSHERHMFVSRVLVGEFTKGSTDFRRPPSKDAGDVNLFDSCVNDEENPSIFVVFEKHQIYPEYLLRYEQKSSEEVVLLAQWQKQRNSKAITKSVIVDSIPMPNPVPTVASSNPMRRLVIQKQQAERRDLTRELAVRKDVLEMPIPTNIPRPTLKPTRERPMIAPKPLVIPSCFRSSVSRPSPQVVSSSRSSTTASYAYMLDCLKKGM